MKEFTIKQYSVKDFNLWNDFISRSKNATFLFNRNFMEYHKDRFEDFSLMVFEKENLVAVLPANKVGDTLHSHQGLTYGGLLYPNVVNGEKAEHILDTLLSFIKANGFKTFYLKQIPSFYLSLGNGEIDFFLLKRGAVLYRKEMNLGIDLKSALHISKSKLKHFRKIEKLNLNIDEDGDIALFWEKVLESRLLAKHNANPVHSLNEIKVLKKLFPDNIKQYSVFFEGKIAAGVTIFESDFVVKSQYGATTTEGEKIRAMDFLFIKLIEKYKNEGKIFFDMGIVGENNDKGYNSGLLKQKEELGCSIFNQDFYKLELV